MCGIVGSVGGNDINHEMMLKSISHRGPDAEGVYFFKDTFLGHTRLAIQDLSENGNQPMFSLDGRYVIIFNGEIYNHLELRKKLVNKYTFSSTSDTQTLLYGFIEYGTEVLNMLNGIFAFAILDTAEGELFIARDHFGVKPLYYYCDKEIFLFSSEIKTFRHFNGLDRSLNFKALSNYLTLLWSPGEITAFSKVKKLLPGHCIRYRINDEHSLNINKYYEIPFGQEYSKLSEELLIKGLEERLLSAVKRQLLSDVPVAFFLSGGLDSSAIVAMAKKIRPGEKFRCYTIKTTRDVEREGFTDDLKYARCVAEYLDLDLVEVEVNIDILADFDKMIYHLDEPQADVAPLNVLKICEQARKDGYKVLLGGTAGDDLFSGYRRHQALRFEKYIGKIPVCVRSVVKFGLNFLPIGFPLFRRIKKATAKIDYPELQRFYGYFEWLPFKMVKSIFSHRSLKIIGSYNPMQYFISLLDNIPNEKSNLNRMLYWEMRTFLVDHNLNYTDKMSMAVGVEVRVPFLDLDLVEFSTLIPPEYKLRGNETKYILKKMMEKYLPSEVIYRKKTGFGAPVRKWVKEDLNDKLNSDLSEDSIKERGIFNYEVVQELITKTKADKIDGAYSLFSLLSIESWMKQFSDKE